MKMFFYSTSSKFKHHLEVKKLSDVKDNAEWIEKIAKWVEDKWGYIRGFPGMV